MICPLCRASIALLITTGAAIGMAGMAPAHADSKELTAAAIADVHTIRHQAGCAHDLKVDPRLQLAAQRHAIDMLNDHTLDGDIGSNGSLPHDRAREAGFDGQVAETVAVNAASAISGADLVSQWRSSAVDFAIISNCANDLIGVWSESSADRTAVVAVYGQLRQPAATQDAGPLPSVFAAQQTNTPLDPFPDYDASDEIQYGINWLPWILRGVYPPPAYPPS